MKRLYQYFFRGLITALPLGLTIYFFYVFLIWVEKFSLWLLRPFIGDVYIPGMGIAIGLVSIVLVGYLVSHQNVHKLLALIEFPFTNLPVVKSIYSSLKSFADYFAPHKESSGQQAVIVKVPGQAMEIVGLITRDHVYGLPEGFMQGDRVAVYFPMGYMIGGYTVFVPRDWCQPIAMRVQDVMRASLFAWMTQEDSSKD